MAWSTTFAPGDRLGDLGLSNGDLTATCTNSSGSGWVRSTSSQTGKVYVEFTIITATNTEIGIAQSGAAVGFPGENTNSFAIFSSGYGALNNTYPDWKTPFTGGNVVSMAYDTVNKLVWYRVNGGNWNGSATANPATGVGGFDVSGGYTGTDSKVIVYLSGSDALTANFGASAFAYAVPAGFTAWDVVKTVNGVASTFAAGSLSISKGIVATGIPGSALLGSPAIGKGSPLDGIASTSAVGLIGISGGIILDGIAGSVSFGTLEFTQLINLVSTENASAFGSPAFSVQLDQNIEPESILSVIAFGEPVLGNGLVPQGFANVSLFGSIEISRGIALTGFTNTSRFGLPYLAALSVDVSEQPEGIAWVGAGKVDDLRLGANRVVRAYLGGACVWPQTAMPLDQPVVPLDYLTPEDAPFTTLAWWRADAPDSFTLDGDKVIEWRDIAYGIPMRQTVAARRPSWSEASFGGTPGVRFNDALQQFLELGSTPWPLDRKACYLVVIVDQLSPPSDLENKTIFSYGNTQYTQRKIQRRVVVGFDRATITYGNTFGEYAHMHQPVLFWGRHAVLTFVTDVSTSLGVDGVFAGLMTQALRTEEGRTRIGSDSLVTASEFANCIVRDVIIGDGRSLTSEHWANLQKWILKRRKIDFFDDFVRMEEDLEKGSNWTLLAGASGIMRVVNNRMVQEKPGTGSLVVSPDVGHADQYVQIKLMAAASVTASPMIAMRIRDVNNYALGMRTENGSLRLYKCVAGVRTAVGAAIPYARNDVFRLTARGSSFQLHRNGEPVSGPHTVTDFATSTRTGVISNAVTVPFIEEYENAL